ncbi:hypothetical protein A2768_01680 [Candidatus Roizmanbacteria bacterium RIFCSPHIGHO2_01_FULL_37_16]|nr:MAG: hypothetical protein A2768_01680 [Candidatus Roizmanbacteria bacterium RIFCSPHIGHO2_01_FULL_37_16]
MTDIECPLMKLNEGDMVVNAYKPPLFLNPASADTFRTNCSQCPTGFMDFTESQATPLADDTTRYQAVIETVIAVKACPSIPSSLNGIVVVIE